MKYGDKYIKYQTVLLASLIIMHSFLAYDLYFNTSNVISWYYPTIIVLMTMQILRGWDGFIKQRFSIPRHTRINKRCLYGIHHPKGNL